MITCTTRYSQKSVNSTGQMGQTRKNSILRMQRTDIITYVLLAGYILIYLVRARKKEQTLRYTTTTVEVTIKNWNLFRHTEQHKIPIQLQSLF